MAVNKPYVRLITKEDIKDEFGYDLEAMVTVGGFSDKPKAVDAWLDEAAESVASIIREKMGRQFLDALNKFVKREENKNDVLYEGLYWAQMYEMRFFIDNGRFASIGKIDPNMKLHDDQTLEILYDYSLIKDGAA